MATLEPDRNFVECVATLEPPTVVQDVAGTNAVLLVRVDSSSEPLRSENINHGTRTGLFWTCGNAGATRRHSRGGNAGCNAVIVGEAVPVTD